MTYESARTRQAYGWIASSAFRSMLQAGDPVDRITSQGLAAWRGALMSQGLATTTVAQRLAAVRSVLRRGVEFGECNLTDQQIRAALRPVKKLQTSFTPVLEDRDAAVLLCQTQNPQMRAMIGVLLGTGIRLAELRALRIADFRASAEGPMMLEIREGKGGRHRNVPVAPQVVRLLDTHLATHPMSKDWTSGMWWAISSQQRRAGPVVYSVPTNGTICRWIGEATEEAGLTCPVGARIFRHTFAMRLLRAGVDVVAISRLLGHSSLAVTTVYLAHYRLAELAAFIPPLPGLE